MKTDYLYSTATKWYAKNADVVVEFKDIDYNDDMWLIFWAFCTITVETGEPFEYRLLGSLDATGFGVDALIPMTRDGERMKPVTAEIMLVMKTAITEAIARSD